MTLRERLMSKVDISGPNGCWLWLGSTNGRGYGQLAMGHAKPKLAHRILFALENGPIPSGMECLHLCDNPTCVNPSHLILGSHRENMLDAAKKGRMQSKLSASDVQEIRELRKSGLTLKSLGERFGVKLTTIHASISGQKWRHV